MHPRTTLHACVAVITLSMIFGLVASVRAADPVSVPTPHVLPNGAVLRPTTRVSGVSLNFTKIEMTYLERLAQGTGSGQTDPTVTSPTVSVSEGVATFLPPGLPPVHTNYITELELARTAPGSNLYSITVPRFDIFGGDVEPRYRYRESPALASTGFATLSPDPTGVGYLLSLEYSVYLEWTEDAGQTWTPLEGPLGLALTSVPEPASLALLAPGALLLKRRRRA